MPRSSLADRQVLADLERELAGRGDDQRLRLAGRDQLVVVGVVRGDAALDHRDAEGQGLARAGAGLADQVGAHQGDREGHLLDREGVHDVDALEGVRNLGKDPELSEGSQDVACSVLTRRVLVGGFNGGSRLFVRRRGAARNGPFKGSTKGIQPAATPESIGRLPT